MAAGQSDIDGAQQGEDKRLDEGHQQFQTAHEDLEEDGDHRHAIAEGGRHLPEDENQRYETQHDGTATACEATKKIMQVIATAIA